MMDEKTLENQTAELDSSILKENSQETSKNGPAAASAAPKSTGTQSFSTLLPKALSAVLPGLHTEPQPGRDPGKRTPAANLEQLQLELRDLKDQFEQMKSQHNKEIKMLMSELDEEKRIRLTLQMEIQRMKKHMSK